MSYESDLLESINSNREIQKELLEYLRGTSGRPGSSGLSAATADAVENLSKIGKSGAGEVLLQIAKGGADFFGSFSGIVKTIDAFTQGAGKVGQGGTKISEAMESMAKLPGAFGELAQTTNALVKLQDESMDSYRRITNSGINLGGSLTDVRLSASYMGMTLKEMSDFVTKNGESLAKMGIGADEGFRSFAILSKELRDGDVGMKFKALGFTTDQLNQYTLDYIKMTGGRSATELQNTKAITKSAGEYLETLDGLSRLTGKSRQVLQDELNQKMQNAAWQAYLNTLNEEQRAAITAGATTARQTGGEGGLEAYMARIMGTTVQSQAGRDFVATFPKTFAAINTSADTAKNFASDAAAQQKATTSLIVTAGKEAASQSTQFVYMMSQTNSSVGKVMLGQMEFANRVRNLQEKGKSIEEVVATLLQAPKGIEESEAGRVVQREQQLMQARDSIVKAQSALFLSAESAITRGVSIYSKAMSTLSGVVQQNSDAIVEYYAKLKLFQGGIEILTGGIGSVVAANNARKLLQPPRPTPAEFAQLTPKQQANVSKGVNVQQSAIKGGLLSGLTIGGLIEGLMTYFKFSNVSEKETAGEITAQEASDEKLKLTLGAVASVFATVLGGVLTRNFGPVVQILSGMAAGTAGRFAVGTALSDDTQKENKGPPLSEGPREYTPAKPEPAPGNITPTNITGSVDNVNSSQDLHNLIGILSRIADHTERTASNTSGNGFYA